MPIHTIQTITTRQDAVTELPNDLANIVARARARDNQIWRTFNYNKIGDGTVRGTMLGLYSSVNENGYAYMVLLTTEDLTRLWENFQVEIQAIDAEHTELLAELWVKEHMAEVDDFIVRNRFVTMRQKNDELRVYYQARMDALDADRATLITKLKQLNYLRDEVANRISRILMQIEKEQVDKQLVQVEVLNKELAVQRQQLRWIEVGLDVMSYQQKLNDASYELALLDSEYNKYAIESRKQDLKEANLDIQDLKNEAALARMNAELAEMGLKLYRLDTDEMELGVKSRKMDLAFVEETIKQLKLDAQLIRLDTELARMGLREVKGETDIVKIEAREYSLDADLVKVNNALASEGIKLKKLEADSLRLDADLAKLHSHEIEEQIMQIKHDNKEYDATVLHDARVALLLAQLANVAQDQRYIDERSEAWASYIEARKKEIFESFAASVTSAYNNYLETGNRKDYEDLQNELRKEYQSLTELPIGSEMNDESRKLIYARAKAAGIGADMKVLKAKKLGEADVTNTIYHSLGTN